jgi:phage terminase small subunit
MGKRGPKKKLSALERLEGNPSKRLIQESGIDGIGEPFTSDHLMMDAKSCVEVIMASMPPGVYRKMDSFMLAAYGMAWALHKRAAEEIGRPDFAWIVANGLGRSTASPWIKILDNQAQLVASLGARLGLDPTSRQALQLPEQRRQSKFHGLIGPLTEQRES